ncbi:hypothetical protein [Amycolatopsis sp. NPDC059021]|uniref:hypothetical protein n=1 Tax=Amycolatopsis sp. NPDC059021 TaxID=3346704 RepID=UPI00366B091C
MTIQIAGLTDPARGDKVFESPQPLVDIIVAGSSAVWDDEMLRRPAAEWLARRGLATSASCQHCGGVAR